MNPNRKGLSLGVVERPMTEAERQRLQSARRSRKILLTIIALVAALAIIAQIVVQYYVGLHR